jgi:nitrite reductase/ring-hydroxylating ferredoxin subunit
MPERFSRRSVFSGLASFLTVTLASAAAEVKEKVKFLERGFFQRLFGNCATPEPKDGGCWSYSGGRVSIKMRQTPELAGRGGAVRLEGKGIPKRVLVVHGDDGQYHAFSNTCTHAGRRLDPVPGTCTVQCCSVGKSTFDYAGKVLYGPAGGPVKPFPMEVAGDTLIVAVS